MRVLAVLAIFTASFLAPYLASADPTQPSTPASTTAQAAPVQAVPAQTTATAQSSAPVQAAPQAAATAATASNGVNLDEIVCRSEPAPTGSRLGASRECHTVRQWNEREHMEQRMLQQQQSVGSAMSN
jgi:hypothetical protein